MPNAHLIPVLWKIDGYSGFTQALARRFSLSPGHNYFEFPYDWRLDNRCAARDLAVKSEQWLSAWREESGNADARLILVAHSMGGLVARYFLEVLRGWQFSRYLITLGTLRRGPTSARPPAHERR